MSDLDGYIAGFIQCYYSDFITIPSSVYSRRKIMGGYHLVDMPSRGSPDVPS
ncbi:MAG: hypothetical protein U9N73_09620 [Candidatus Auribacterota bacterium]|nr:hypothetical protein [Candidatus Auribacterota bacterium]